MARWFGGSRLASFVWRDEKQEAGEVCEAAQQAEAPQGSGFSPMRRTFARTRCTTDRTHMSTMWLEENTYDSSPRTAGLLAVLANLNPMDCFVWGYTSILYLETHICIPTDVLTAPWSTPSRRTAEAWTGLWWLSPTPPSEAMWRLRCGFFE